MVCIAMMFGPVKHSTYLRTYSEENIRKNIRNVKDKRKDC